MRRSVFGPDAWERRETVGVCNTCLRDAETLNVLGHRPLSHGACGVSVTPVFPFTYGPSEFQGALIQTVSFVYTTVQQTDFSLPHGLQRALLSMDIISANRLSKWTMDNGTLGDLY